jgi:large subunit ribosomal protein L15
MASNLPSRSLEPIFTVARSRSRCVAASNRFAIRQTQRGLTSTNGKLSEQKQASASSEEKHSLPRWSYTPPGAKAPFRLRDLQDRKPHYKVNEDPAILDRFYVRMLGNGGDKLLSDEVKWLAVTHKSFDQGRRGYNERLAFLGMYQYFINKIA